MAGPGLLIFKASPRAKYERNSKIDKNFPEKYTGHMGWTKQMKFDFHGLKV